MTKFAFFRCSLHPHLNDPSNINSIPLLYLYSDYIYLGAGHAKQHLLSKITYATYTVQKTPVATSVYSGDVQRGHVITYHFPLTTLSQHETPLLSGCQQLNTTFSPLWCWAEATNNLERHTQESGERTKYSPTGFWEASNIFDLPLRSVPLLFGWPCRYMYILLSLGAVTLALLTYVSYSVGICKI